MPVAFHRQDTPAGAAAVQPVLAEIAADYRLRLADGGTEPPLRGLKLVRDHRLGALRLARELGGAGYTAPEFFDYLVALAAADPDLAHILRIHYALVEELQVTPRRPGSDRWIAVVAEGGLIGGANAEQSQKSVGGNHRDTRLVTTPDGLRLRGRKFYSTGAQFSDYLRITAQDDDGAPTAVVIPVDRAGVEHLDDWDGIGQRQTGSGTTVFNDVAVADDEVFPLGSTIGVNRARGALVQLYLHAAAELAPALQAACDTGIRSGTGSRDRRRPCQGGDPGARRHACSTPAARPPSRRRRCWTGTGVICGRCSRTTRRSTRRGCSAMSPSTAPPCPTPASSDPLAWRR